MDPIIHLRRAKEALGGDGSSRSRLQTAGQEFWKALFDLGTWPLELREAADQITDVLLADGSIDATVPRMDEATVHETLQRLSAFCDRAESILGG